MISGPSSQLRDWRGERAIRVFVSSTFTDMQAERDILARRVFPEIRQTCERHGVVFAEIDLRWGITEEQREQRLVLSTCLWEIDQCHPFFLCLLGERYGTPVMPEPADRAQYPWLAGHCDRSLLELEIRHGALNPPICRGEVLFLQRAKAARASDASDPRLMNLVAEIAKHHAIARYENVDHLAGIVAAHFERVLREVLGAPSDAADPVSAAHRAYAAVRGSGALPRPALHRVLDEHVAGRGPPLVIAGDPGSGRTSLVMSWLAEQRAPTAKRARWRASRTRGVAVHAAGAAPWAADWPAALRHLWREIACDDPALARPAVPAGPEELRERFAELVAGTSRQLVLVLDGPDEIDPSGGGRALEWLPRAVSPSIRLIVTVSTRTAPTLAERGWRVIAMQPLSCDERYQITDAYLAGFGKNLPRDLRTCIAEAPACGNPLYLRLVLGELRLFGIHERLPARVSELLAKRSPHDVFALILARIEADCRGGAGVVATALGAVAASRTGLTEAELAALLQAECPAAWTEWPPVRTALSDALDALVLQCGYLRFANPILAEVVRERYIRPCPAAVHRRLAIHFDTRVTALRRIVDELPEQLVALSDWAGLRCFLSTPARFAEAWSHRALAVETWWRRIEHHGAGNAIDAYAAARELDTWAPAAAWAAALFLRRFRQLAPAQAIWESLIRHYTTSCAIAAPSQQARVAWRALESCHGNLASVLRDLGRYEDAWTAYRRQETMCRALGDRHALQACLGNQGLLAAQFSRFAEADRLHHEEEQLCRQLRLVGPLAWSLIHRARIALLEWSAGPVRRSRLRAALAQVAEAARLARHADDLRGIISAAGVRGGALRLLGRLRHARAAFEHQLSALDALGDPLSAAQVLVDLGDIAMEMRKFDRAQQYVGEIARRASGDDRILVWGAYLQATLFSNLKLVRQAHTVAARGLHTCRRTGQAELEAKLSTLLVDLDAADRVADR